MVVVSISMPDALVDRLDAYAEEHGYGGRSEVVRRGARTLLDEFAPEKCGDGTHVCTLTVIFDYGSVSVETRLSRLRHAHDGVVRSNAHAHVGERYCAELFVLEGPIEDVSAFVGDARAVRDVVAIEYSTIPLADLEAPRPAE
ncbi:CopG family ribbon-helix-helix protein [Halegenticoccus tardaugens]|uniref:CopG family ribbon-helix-helix protein n=1 Tax=Halegenticoccus tardaugens TaxID=2071624 RepID=UPI00100BAB38|nr:CopG family ribbon-helix-helix protein [Halegenticoccus tardaugens]